MNRTENRYLRLNWTAMRAGKWLYAEGHVFSVIDPVYPEFFRS